MIFTHSYNKGKMFIDIGKRENINTVYINKLHTIGQNVEKTFLDYKENKFKIIYESPLYASHLSNYLLDEDKKIIQKNIEKRNLEKEFLSKSKLIYINNHQLYLEDIKNAWNQYLYKINKMQINVETVLTLPTYNKITDDLWDEIEKNIPSHSYNHLSIAINKDNASKENLEKLFIKIQKLHKKINFKKTLFTLNKNISNEIYAEIEIHNINSFLIKLSKVSNIVVHHLNDFVQYLPKNIEISIGYDSQTKSISNSLNPLSMKEETIKRKANSVFISYFLTEFKIDKISPIIKSGLSNNTNSFQKIWEIFNNNTEYESLKKSYNYILNDVKEYKKIVNSNHNIKNSWIENGKTLISNLVGSEREALYQIKATQFLKLVK